MAKDYLTLEQVCEALGRTEDQVKELIRDGKLREVRDAGKVFFKNSEVASLAGKEGSSGVNLEATDEATPMEIEIDDNDSFASALSSLADSSATLGALDESPGADEPPQIEPLALSGEDSGTSMGMSPPDEPAQKDAGEGSGAKPAELDAADIPKDLPAAPKEDAAAGGAGAKQPELSSEIDLVGDNEQGSSIGLVSPEAVAEEVLDTVPDLGLSGSSIISLEPSGDSSVTPSPVSKEDAKTQKAGISVFDDDELDVEADPMGETQISSGVEDFDAVGSGSGLLDLTQEPDDSSLGAELLDVISPSEAAETEVEAEAIPAETVTEDESAAVMAAPEPRGAATVGPAAPRVAAGAMAGSVPMNLCILVGLIGLAVMGLATASVLQGAWPAQILDVIAKDVIHWSAFGGLALIAIVTGVMAILAGRK
ncbi:MAG: helix-turn-helix domain-containing protein [Phycisphaerae bacterium]